MLHCAKNNQNLPIKTESVRAGADDIYCPLRLLQTCQARFLCRNSNYFWDSVSERPLTNDSCGRSPAHRKSIKTEKKAKVVAGRMGDGGRI